MTKLRNDNKGAALVYILITVVIAGILTTGLIMLIVNRVRMQTVDEQKAKEYYLADGVVEIIRNNNKNAVQELAAQFTGLPLDSVKLVEVIPAPETLEDGSEKLWTQSVLYYVVSSDHSCVVVYYGEQYRTEITCVWDIPQNSEEQYEYTVSQTPKPTGEVTP